MRAWAWLGSFRRLLPGGSGQIGRMRALALRRAGHTPVVLTRQPAAAAPDADPRGREVARDGRTLGPWAAELDGADAVINLAGRSVNCRYHRRHLAEMLDSRVASTRVLGQAIAQARHPPRVWLQASTATIYAHTFGAPHDEATGTLGGGKPGVPARWGQSIAIARAWEGEVDRAATPRTRKVVLRAAMVMSPDRGGVFAALARLARLGVGAQGDGRQFVSWVHEHDFVAAVEFLLGREELAGVFNVCSPHPLPNRAFMAALGRACGRRLAVPVPRWALEFGAFFLRTETELILKSRRVVPGRLLHVGFNFRHPDWPAAAAELVRRWRAPRWSEPGAPPPMPETLPARLRLNAGRGGVSPRAGRERVACGDPPEPRESHRPKWSVVRANTPSAFRFGASVGS